MEASKICILSVVIAVVAVIAAAAAIVISNDDDHECNSDVYKFCVGCGDIEEDSPELAAIESSIENLICNVHHDGYTLYVECGATYISEGNISRDNVTLVYEIAYLPDGDASILLDEMKDVSGVGVILCEKYHADLTLRL